MAIHRNLHRPYFQYVGFIFSATEEAIANIINLEQFDSFNLVLVSRLKYLPLLVTKKSVQVATACTCMSPG